MRRDRRNLSFAHSPQRIVLIYALFGGGWILFSDLLTAKLFPEALFGAVSIVKGWLFIAGTSLVLMLLLRRYHAARVRLEHRNREIIDNLPSLLYAFDREGRLVLVNQAMSQLFGIAPDQVRGQDRVALGIAPPTAAEHRDNDLRVFATGQPLLMKEQNLMPDGLHTYLTVKFPLTDADGTIEAVCGISTDISDRERAEVAIQEQLAELQRWQNVMVDREDRVQEIKREVNALCRQLKEPIRYPSQEADETGRTP